MANDWGISHQLRAQLSQGDFSREIGGSNAQCFLDFQRTRYNLAAIQEKTVLDSGDDVGGAPSTNKSESWVRRTCTLYPPQV